MQDNIGTMPLYRMKPQRTDAPGGSSLQKRLFGRDVPLARPLGEKTSSGFKIVLVFP